MKIRAAQTSDQEGIHDVLVQAFGETEGPVVATLTFDLLADASALPLTSLVAEKDGRVLAYCLFTTALIDGFNDQLSAQILAPLAVMPKWQNTGLGKKLIDEGMTQLKSLGVDIVFVLGHPTYYPKSGFIPVGARGFDAPFPIAEKNKDAWMYRVLNTSISDAIAGTVQCAQAMNKEEYWRE